MLGFRKYSIFIILFILVLSACKKADDLSTLADFLSKDDSDSKILRKYKTWVVSEGSIVREGLPTLIYKKGQPIQGNFDPSKISFVFSANNTFQGTDEKGKPESGQWLLEESPSILKLVTSQVAESFDIIQLTKTNLDLKNDEKIEDKSAVVIIKMVPNR